MEDSLLAPFSVALAVPAHRGALLRCMLESAAHELRTRGIRWTLVGGTEADVTFRQRPPVPGAVGSGDLYADLVRANGDGEQIRIDGPLRSTALVAVLARVARRLRTGASDTGSSQAAFRFLEQWCSHTDGALLELRVGDRAVAVLDPRNALWHSIIGTATPDIEALLDRMTREDTVLVPAAAPVAAPGVPLKPLLWQLALGAGAAGLLPTLSGPSELRLKGWPYLAAGGPRSFGEMIRHLRGAPIDLVALRELGLAPREELHGFLNACHVCGYLQAMPAPLGFGQRRGASPAVAPSLAIVRRGNGRSAGVLASIRRSLGIGAE